MKSDNQIDSEKLLYKLILQFSIFTCGLNKKLDPYLLKISKSLKQGKSFQELSSDLQAISNTLTHLSISASQPSNDKNSTPILLLLKEFIDRLNKLLAETDIPLKFKRKYDLLTQKSKKDLDEKDCKKVIDLALALLIDIKDYALSEQQSLENFLTNMSSQFNKLEGHAQNFSKSNELSIVNRETLKDAINIEVENLQQSTDHAENLSSLKENITLHLKELTSQLQKHQNSEVDRELENSNYLLQMTQQRIDMEIEADTLRNNLQIAHDKALLDKLTEIPNRMAYDERASLEYSRWHRYKSSLSLVVWDIDLFKVINDTYGHKAGDKTLTLVAQLIFNSCRDTDFIARYGGEEFVMLLPNTSSKQTLVAAEKIRGLIAQSGFNHHGQSIKLTISCGISEFSEGDQHSDVFERADQALYISKEQGRNRCTIKNQ